ncbi:hypothetical protein [Kribbella antiqua]|uniref:hypothetical protein n=1 Tax=Kribbella antiqua TaxID=2512217 RepID=UPI001052876A|nr:hypothetical protein [Kribbella antiqua]
MVAIVAMGVLLLLLVLGLPDSRIVAITAPSANPSTVPYGTLVSEVTVFSRARAGFAGARAPRMRARRDRRPCYGTPYVRW